MVRINIDDVTFVPGELCSSFGVQRLRTPDSGLLFISPPFPSRQMRRTVVQLITREMKINYLRDVFTAVARAMGYRVNWLRRDEIKLQINDISLLNKHNIHKQK